MSKKGHSADRLTSGADRQGDGGVDRRTLLRRGAALSTVPALSGCLGGPSQQDGSAAASTGEVRTATLEPVGEVEVDGVPERVVCEWGVVADVLVSLGHGDAVVGMSRPGFWHTGFYEELSGVDVPDIDGIQNTVTPSYRADEELIREIDPDLLATDPNRWLASYNVDEEGIERYENTVAPFFGNYSNEKRPSDWPDWPDGEYAYYPLSELVEAYGELFGETERAKRVVEFRERAIDGIVGRLPPESERPTVGLLNTFRTPDAGGTLGVYDPVPERDDTHALRQYGDLGVVNAFADETDGAAGGNHFDLQVDTEGLLEVDPDVLVFHNAVSTLGAGGGTVYGSSGAYEDMVTSLRSDPAGRRLSAVENDRLYPGGMAFQGPIINLFQTEMLAKQLYPEEFGRWRGLGETPQDEWLFDREELSAVVGGRNREGA